MRTPVKAIVVFHHVATLGSVAGAAEAMGVTASAITQQIRALEHSIGSSLVVRVGRRIKLTEAGERYFDMIADHVAGIIEASDLMQGRKTPTVLTIRATPTISTKWLLPRLPRFVDAHPGIDIRLDSTNEPTDFNRDPVDIEVRHGTGQWSGLHVEALAEERFLPVCAPALAGAGSLDAQDLARFRLIRSVKSQAQWSTWFPHLLRSPQPRFSLISFDRSHMAIDAAALGLGIALESTLMMGCELRDGVLVAPLRDPPDIRLTTQWLVCPHAHLQRAGVRQFLDWVRAQATAWQDDEAAAIA